MTTEIIQSSELLNQTPVHVTWTDTGYSGLLTTHAREVSGDFFTITFDGQNDDELQEFSLNPPASFSGSIEYGKYEGEPTKYLAADQLDVEPGFRRNHLGERLSKALAYIAEQQGCEAIKAQFTHPASLKIFRKIYGDERIRFFGRDDWGETQPLNISADQALQRITKEREHIMKHGRRRAFGGSVVTLKPESDDDIPVGAAEGVEAWIDIRGFDTSRFEVPLQSGELPESE